MRGSARSVRRSAVRPGLVRPRTLIRAGRSSTEHGGWRRPGWGEDLWRPDGDTRLWRDRDGARWGLPPRPRPSALRPLGPSAWRRAPRRIDTKQRDALRRCALPGPAPLPPLRPSPPPAAAPRPATPRAAIAQSPSHYPSTCSLHPSPSSPSHFSSSRPHWPHPHGCFPLTRRPRPHAT